jgi:hypothetical protein
MKVRPVGAELFHPDRRTGTTKLTVVFLNVSNALKTVSNNHHMNVINILLILMKSGLIYEPRVYVSHTSAGAHGCRRSALNCKKGTTV